MKKKRKTGKPEIKAKKKRMSGKGIAAQLNDFTALMRRLNVFSVSWTDIDIICGIHNETLLMDEDTFERFYKTGITEHYEMQEHDKNYMSVTAKIKGSEFCAMTLVLPKMEEKMKERLRRIRSRSKGVIE